MLLSLLLGATPLLDISILLMMGRLFVSLNYYIDKDKREILIIKYIEMC